MEYRQPSVHRIAATELCGQGVYTMLAAMGAEGWGTDARSGSEALTEVLGRLCYRAFGADLNPNLTRVREGNTAYLANIIKQQHGSVLEHASVTYAFMDVSRVFTHEVVRHRAGMAFSQESLRFVRLDRLNARYPEAFEVPALVNLYDALPEEVTEAALDLYNTKEEVDHLVEAGQDRETAKREVWARRKAALLRREFTGTFERLEHEQRRVAEMLNLDNLPDGTFAIKKEITSAMRRLAPIGLTTNIGVTGNHRAWRHIIGMRCTPHAEEEIRQVMFAVAQDMAHHHPAIYQDMVLDHETRTVVFAHEKI